MGGGGRQSHKEQSGGGGGGGGGPCLLATLRKMDERILIKFSEQAGYDKRNNLRRNILGIMRLTPWIQDFFYLVRGIRVC